MFINHMQNLSPVHTLQILSAASWEQLLVYSHISINVCKTYFIDILCCTLSLKVVEECNKRGTVGQTNSADTLEENNKVSVLKDVFCRLLSRKQRM
jgi:hypothetical protein